ncbi:MAG: ankyrin repeat domain-containing protein [Alphaproteobacteria bacterium]|nr:ankyrin repeat domain-containing protein [Alphaproteobacteria bacterium]
MNNGVNKELLEALDQGGRGESPALLAYCRRLVTMGADVNARDRGNWTPLLRAVCRSDKAVMNFLLDHGADIDAVNRLGTSALHLAVFRKDVAAAKLLLDRGAHVDRQDAGGTTPLMNAVLRRHDAMIDLLLVHGADMDAQDLLGRSVLGYASGERLPVQAARFAVEEYRRMAQSFQEAAAKGTVRARKIIRRGPKP